MFFNIACDDFIEPDISNLKINLLAPSDSLTTLVTSQLFWWEICTGASYYNLQIVKPDFNSISQLAVDTIVESNKFSISLQPGQYQWRVCGINSTSRTQFSYHTLYIDSTSDLYGQFVILSTPPENYVTNDDSIVFQWNDLYGADEYLFIIKNDIGLTIIDTLITDNTIYASLNEGEYSWFVSARNSASYTNNSMRDLKIDLTPPAAPLISYPMNNDTVSGGLQNLQWISDSESIGDSLKIFSDSLETNLFYSGYTLIQNYNYNFSQNMMYYWKIKSRDTAGNWGQFTSLYRFYVE